MRIDSDYLCLFLSLSVTALFLRAARYHFLLKQVSEEGISFPGALILTSVRNALVDTLPARMGELSYFYISRRMGLSIPDSAAVFAICFALDIVVLLVLVAFILLLGAFGASPFIGAAVLVFTLFAGLCVWYSESILKFVLGFVKKSSLREEGKTKTKLGKILSSAEEFLDKLTESFGRIGNSRCFIVAISYTFLLRILKYGSLYCLLLAVTISIGLGPEEIGPLASSLGFISAEAAASLPISGFMGFGAYEGTFSIINKAVGGLIPDNVSTIFIVHLVTQVVGYSFGAIGALAFALYRRQAT